MTGLHQPQITALMGRLNPARVAKRNQGGRDLSYLEAYDVKATLIRIFGFGGFSSETVRAEIIRENWYPHPQQEHKMLVQVTALCTVRLTIHATGAVYQESGAASQSGPDHGEVCDFAIKTAESDALKRAATFLGTQFGLSLYAQGTTAEIVRVLFEPDQAAMLPKADTPSGAAGADLSDEAAAALSHSLGAEIVSETPTEPTGPDFQPDHPQDVAAQPEPGEFPNKADTPSEAARAVAAMTESARQRGVKAGN